MAYISPNLQTSKNDQTIIIVGREMGLYIIKTSTNRCLMGTAGSL